MPAPMNSACASENAKDKRNKAPHTVASPRSVAGKLIASKWQSCG